jgi:hypothetical protein
MNSVAPISPLIFISRIRVSKPRTQHYYQPKKRPWPTHLISALFT